MARTSTKKDNRERARQRRVELDAERARRDAAIEDAASAFYDAEDARAELAERLAAVDEERAAAVAALVELKETNGRIAQLLDVNPAEVRRLRELGAERDMSASERASTDREHEADGMHDAARADGAHADAQSFRSDTDDREAA